MARSRGRRAGAEPNDLEVLDPVTGEPLTAVGGRDGDRRRRPERPAGTGRKSGWLRTLAALLVLAAAASASGALYFGFTISSLRSIDRTWAEAMALDRARKAADVAVLEQHRSFDASDRDGTRRAAIGRIGEETAAGLRRHEDRLRARWIVDDRVDALRDAMAEALRFRRFQLSPDRTLLGDTPLQRVEELLEAQLARFDLERSTSPVPTLRSAVDAVAALRRFADVRTGTVLAAVDERRLVTVDIDASTIETRLLTAPPTAVVRAAGLAVLLDESGLVTAYPLDPAEPPAWTVEASALVTSATGRDVWVQQGSDALAVDEGGSTSTATPLPAGSTLLAETELGLLVQAGEELRIVAVASGAPLRTVATTGRFAGASAGYVAVQTPGRPTLAIHRLADGVVTGIDLPRTDAGHIVQAPQDEVFAFAAGPLAGNIASILRLELRGNGWHLVGLDGPRGTVEEGGLVWSPSGETLFWLTPEGRVAYAGGDEPALLRTTLDGLDRVVAFPRQG